MPYLLCFLLLNYKNENIDSLNDLTNASDIIRLYRMIKYIAVFQSALFSFFTCRK